MKNVLAKLVENSRKAIDDGIYNICLLYTSDAADE